MSFHISVEYGRSGRSHFHVQSGVASNGATAEDITPEISNKKSGKVKEFKSRAIDDYDHLPCNGCLNASLSEASNKKSGKVKEFKSRAIDDYDHLPCNGCLNASLSEAGQQSSDEEELDDVTDNDVYDTEDSSMDDAELDSLCRALVPKMPSSSKPEETRSKNFPNGGRDLTPDFPDNSNRRSTINKGKNVIINAYKPTINLGGHTLNQYAGSRDSRQYQAVNVSGGTVTQGNVSFAGGGAAKYGSKNPTN